MYKLITFSVLTLSAMPVLADISGRPVPSPEVLPLLGIGVAALVIARRLKK